MVLFYWYLQFDWPHFGRCFLCSHLTSFIIKLIGLTCKVYTCSGLPLVTGLSTSHRTDWVRPVSLVVCSPTTPHRVPWPHLQHWPHCGLPVAHLLQALESRVAPLPWLSFWPWCLTDNPFLAGLPVWHHNAQHSPGTKLAGTELALSWYKLSCRAVAVIATISILHSTLLVCVNIRLSHIQSFHNSLGRGLSSHGAFFPQALHRKFPFSSHWITKFPLNSVLP